MNEDACLRFVGNPFFLSYLVDPNETFPDCSGPVVLQQVPIQNPDPFVPPPGGTVIPPVVDGELTVNGLVTLISGIDSDTFVLAVESIMLALVIAAVFSFIISQLQNR